ncbi:MAG: hypothetical protein LBD53_10255 [Tannerella sp.]|jgi:hypothetical protein|nr:hypothetical protein [Tannerella sp.]
MTKAFIYIGVSLTLILSCEVSQDGETPCDCCPKSTWGTNETKAFANRKTIFVLKDEPAVVNYGCFLYYGKAGRYDISLESSKIFPDGVLYIFTFESEIPESFRVAGKNVYVSGNITDIVSFNEALMASNVRLAPQHYFELTSIKDRKE